MAINIDSILMASKIADIGLWSGVPVKPGQRMAQFYISELELVSLRSPLSIVDVIRMHMEAQRIERITHHWKAHDTFAHAFAGPVATHDALTGILLTRKFS